MTVLSQALFVGEHMDITRKTQIAHEILGTVGYELYESLSQSYRDELQSTHIRWVNYVCQTYCRDCVWEPKIAGRDDISGTHPTMVALSIVELMWDIVSAIGDKE